MIGQELGLIRIQRYIYDVHVVMYRPVDQDGFDMPEDLMADGLVFDLLISGDTVRFLPAGHNPRVLAYVLGFVETCEANGKPAPPAMVEYLTTAGLWPRKAVRQ